MFFLLYRHTNDGVIDDFPKISDHFLKIYEDFQNMSEGRTNVAEHFPKFSKDYHRLPKIAEDFRGRHEVISIINQPSTNEFKYNLRDKLEDMENTPLEPRMWFRMNFASGVFSS